MAELDDIIKDPAVIPLALSPLRVAAFNIQVFGVKKFSKKDVTEVLLKILIRYDLVLLLEIRDRSQTTIDRLIKSLNRLDPDDPFSCDESERLGRTNSKEQYVFLYRKSRLSITDTYQYDDGLDDGTDAFQREPYAVRFSSPTTELKDFAIIAIHTDPGDAVRELATMSKVYDVTKARWSLENILIAGDFNADEGYVDREDWANIGLRTDKRFKWLIKDETDTTVGNTDRAYDRFVVAGKDLTQSVVPGSVKAYRFDRELKLSPEEAEDVSDHYPIELHLRGEVNRAVQRNMSSQLAVVIQQTEPLESVESARQIYRTDDPDESAGFTSTVLKKGSSMCEVRATRSNVRDVVSVLRDFQNTFPDVITDDTLSMTSAYMTSAVMTSPPVVYGLVQDVSPSYEVTVSVALQEPYLCQVTVARRIS